MHGMVMGHLELHQYQASVPEGDCVQGLDAVRSVTESGLLMQSRHAVNPGWVRLSPASQQTAL